MKKLERTLSLPGAIAVSIGGMLSGIFVLPGLAVGITGSSVWLAFLVAALCILPAVLSKSELGTAMPKSGGTYVYIERAFGPLFGTIAGIGLWLSLLLKSAFSLVGLSAYLYVVVNIDEAYTKAIALLALLLIFLLNVFGLKKVEKTQLFIVSTSIISLIVIIALGLTSFDTKLTEPVFSDGTNGFIAGVAFLYISYAGVTKIAAIAGEITNPSKNLPLTMIISLFLITIILIATFDSFYFCFVILSAVIFSTIGVMIGLIITGKPFGIIMSGIGVIALAGIVVNNNIVLLDTYKELRNKGENIKDAIIRTGVQRLRPVLLTTLTTFFGLIPMAIGLNINFLDLELNFGSPSSQWWIQLSNAIVFGVMFSFILTLIITPCLILIGEKSKLFRSF